MVGTIFPGLRPYSTPSRGSGWALIAWGVLAIIFGIAVIIWPGLTLLDLAIIFGIFAIIAGVVELIHTFTTQLSTEGRVLLGLRGLATLIIGLIAVIFPGLAIGAYVLLLGVYFFIVGILEIFGAFRGHFHGWLLLRGVIAVIAGIVAVLWPGIAALTLAFIFGIYALLAGFTALFTGISLLRHHGGSATSTGYTGRARAG